MWLISSYQKSPQRGLRPMDFYRLRLEAGSTHHATMLRKPFVIGVLGPNRRKYALRILGCIEPGKLFAGKLFGRQLLAHLREVERREVDVELVAPIEVDVLPGHG